MDHPKVRFENLLDQWRQEPNGPAGLNPEVFKAKEGFDALLHLTSGGARQVTLEISAHPFDGAEVLHRQNVPIEDSDVPFNREASYTLKSYRNAKHEMNVRMGESLLPAMGVREFPEEVFFKTFEVDQ